MGFCDSPESRDSALIAREEEACLVRLGLELEGRESLWREMEVEWDKKR